MAAFGRSLCLILTLWMAGSRNPTVIPPRSPESSPWWDQASLKIQQNALRSRTAGDFRAADALYLGGYREAVRHGDRLEGSIADVADGGRIRGYGPAQMYGHVIHPCKSLPGRIASRRPGWGIPLRHAGAARARRRCRGPVAEQIGGVMVYGSHPRPARPNIICPKSWVTHVNLREMPFVAALSCRESPLSAVQGEESMAIRPFEVPS